ncbi:hypothetical protein GGI35DRAFT_64521 [Trichoderma velutinum]
MTNKKNIISDHNCEDTASSTDGCLTPSSTMSEDIPIREKEEDTPKTEDDTHQNEEDIPNIEEGTSDSKAGKAKEGSTSQENTTKAVENDSNLFYDNRVHHMELHPVQDRNYMIREHQEPHRILGLQNGESKLIDTPRPDVSVLWSCHGKNHWLGFRNTASGTYLGYDEAGKVLATESTHKVREHFIAVRCPSGGYILHTFHSEEKLQQVAIVEDGAGLSVQEEGGTAWDFIDEDDVASSMTLFPNMEKERRRLH